MKSIKEKSHEEEIRIWPVSGRRHTDGVDWRPLADLDLRPRDAKPIDQREDSEQEFSFFRENYTFYNEIYIKENYMNEELSLTESLVVTACTIGIALTVSKMISRHLNKKLDKMVAEGTFNLEVPEA